MDRLAENDDLREPLPGLADRLNLVFEALHPRRRGPYSDSEVVYWLARSAGSDRSAVSENDLTELRSGMSSDLPEQAIVALAEFFGVPPAYLLRDNGQARAVYGDLRRIVAARGLLDWVGR